jgi:hypothetical protein
MTNDEGASAYFVHYVRKMRNVVELRRDRKRCFKASIVETPGH